jgi:hypothetical protein
MMNLALWLLLTGTALSEDSGTESWGDFRLIQSTLSDFSVDAEGTTISQGAWLDQRLRLGQSYQMSVARFETEWEVNTPQLIGDTWQIPGVIDERSREVQSYTILPRSIAATTYVGNTMIQGGLVTSHWGLGMLANDGAHDPWFGRTDLADRVIRLRATRLPHRTGAQSKVSFLATGAIDMVVADDMMRLADDQLAFQAIASGLWKGQDGRQWGAYSVFRHQMEADRSRSTSAIVLDGYGDGNWKIADWTVRAAGEGVVITGRTNRATTYNARETVGIVQLAGTGVLEATEPGKILTLRLRTGIGSGDGNPDDSITWDFTFDRNFPAGMLMFDQLTGGIEAASHSLISNPGLSGQPPDGVEALVTEGAIKRAGFVQPAVSVNPLPVLQVRVGSTITWATAPIAQPFYTYRAGGSPTSHHNEASVGRFMGVEINWATSVGLVEGLSEASFRPSLDLQGGHLLLGPTLGNSGTAGPIHSLMAVGRLQW